MNDKSKNFWIGVMAIIAGIIIGASAQAIIPDNPDVIVVIGIIVFGAGCYFTYKNK